MNLVYFALLLFSASEDRAIELLKQGARARAQLDRDYCGSAALENKRQGLHIRYKAQAEKWVASFNGDQVKIMNAVPIVVTTYPVSCPDSQILAAEKLEQVVKQLEEIGA